MTVHAFLFAVLAAFIEPSAESQDNPQARRVAAWQAKFDRAAAGYKIYRDQEHREKLRLRAEPVYKWKAASADDGIFGAVYVWTHDGCAENVACFWRSVQGVQVSLAHEFHSLSPVPLVANSTPRAAWRPKAGLKRQQFDEAPAPLEKAPVRLAQMRRLAGGFSAHTESLDGGRTELRLLSAPLYRYESTSPEAVDGALFAFVCSVGTDPEAFLLLEARPTDDGPRWHYALARFSHLDTFVSYGGKQVWKAVRGGNDTIFHNADDTYLLFGEPAGEEDGER